MNFRGMPRKLRRIWTSQFFTCTRVLLVYKRIKSVRTNVAKAQIDFQKSPSSDLIWRTERLPISLSEQMKLKSKAEVSLIKYKQQQFLLDLPLKT